MKENNKSKYKDLLMVILDKHINMFDVNKNLTEEDLVAVREMEDAMIAAFHEAMYDSEFRKKVNCLAKNERRPRRNYEKKDAMSNERSVPGTKCIRRRRTRCPDRGSIERYHFGLIDTEARAEF